MKNRKKSPAGSRCFNTPACRIKRRERDNCAFIVVFVNFPGEGTDTVNMRSFKGVATKIHQFYRCEKRELLNAD